MGNTTDNSWITDSTVSDSTSGISPRETRVPALTIATHPDLGRVGDVARLPRLRASGVVTLSRLEPPFLPADGSGTARPLMDPHVSRRAVVLRRHANGGVVLEIAEGLRVGVDDAEVTGIVELSPNQVEQGVVLILGRHVAVILHTVGPPPPPGPALGLVGHSDPLLNLRAEIRRVADLSVPILLRGESGTGKELVAAALHRLSPRAQGPYLAVNMAAIPPTTAASELFGHERGAFTGAQGTRRGLFELADGGTLLLDEIGATPREVQDMLLRILESGELWPLGAKRPRTVDVRVVAATDADLEAEAERGSFRPPLYHRLAAVTIDVPPLRTRRDDIPRLFLHFLREELLALGEERLLEQDHGPILPASVIAHLVSARWPGNVRELKNTVRRIAVASRGARQLSFEMDRRPDDATEQLARPEAPPRLAPREIDDELLLTTLRAHGFALQPAARALGISRTSLYELVERCPRLRKAGDLPEDELRRAFRETDGDLEAMAAALEVSPRGLKRRMKALRLLP